ncbi:MAG: FAD-dependent monooxygenase, partial [Verrucomicrobiae bacterium]|nr:FAD-dependent monooxygenase [Verrucomicrobiae bacterium]
MWNKKHPNVLITGAGPVGLTAAISLHEKDIDFEIIDKAPGPSRHSKACLLSPETLELLDDMGLIESVLRRAVKIHSIQLYHEEKRLGLISLGQLPTRFPFIVSLPQTELELILLDHLSVNHRKVQWNYRLAAISRKNGDLEVEVETLGEHMTGYSVMHEERLVDSSLKYVPKVLLAADGIYSLVRRLQKISYDPVGRDYTSVLFEVRRNPREDGVLKLGFTKHGISAYVPLPHGLGRFGFVTESVSEVSSDRDTAHYVYDEDLEKFPDLAPERFKELLNKRMPYLVGHNGEVTWRASVPFGARLADKIWSDGIFLLGDAARSGYPIGAKGLNLGLPEARKVAEAVVRFLKKGDDSVVRKAAETMRTEWEDLSALSFLDSRYRADEAHGGPDPNLILQSLPLSGNTLDYVAHKLSELIELEHVTT